MSNSAIAASAINISSLLNPHQQVHSARRGDDVHVVMHDGCPTACVDSAAFAYVGAFTAHVTVGFFHGAALPDPAGLLQGSGKFMRHVKLVPDRSLDRPAIEALITAAYVDVRERLEAEPATSR